MAELVTLTKKTMHCW